MSFNASKKNVNASKKNVNASKKNVNVSRKNVNVSRKIRLEEERQSAEAIETFISRLSEIDLFEERLQFLQSTTVNLDLYGMPELILDRFVDVKTMDDAKEVVDALVSKINSKIIICRYQSNISGEIMTIMDVIGSVDRTWKEKPSRRMFIEAFKQCGVLGANDTCKSLLEKRYGPDYKMVKKRPDYLQFDELDAGEDDLYNALCEATTIEAFINILRKTTCDFHEMIRPRCNFLCEDASINDSESDYFHEWTIEEALQVAQIFKDRLGVVAISRMDTYHSGELTTVMDALDYEVNTYEFDEKARLFHRAFEQLGFKRAKECNPHSLYQLQVNASARYETVEWNGRRLHIELLQPHYKTLNHEIIMEVFKPMRIQTWLDSGNELEDYMN